MPPSRRPPTVAALVSVLVLGACGSGGSESSDDATGVATVPSDDSAPAVDGTPPSEDDAPSSDAVTTAPPASDPAADEATTTSPVVVPDALQFSAPLVGGGTLDAATLAGRPTLFWFWAPT